MERSGRDSAIRIGFSFSDRTARWIAWVAVALFFVFTSIGTALQLICGKTSYNLGFPLLIIVEIVSGLWSVIGAVIVSRQPRHPVGWILLFTLITWAPQSLSFGYLACAPETGITLLPGYSLANLWLTWSGQPFAAFSFTLLFLLFPTGRLLSRRWAFIGWAALVGFSGTLVFQPFKPGITDWGIGLTSSYAVDPSQWRTLRLFYWLVNGIVILALLAAQLSLVLRFRISHGVERQQLKWFVYAATAVFVGFVFVAFVTEGLSVFLYYLYMIFFILSLVGLALAIALAVLRYRLYDIDLIINRSLVYGTLTLTLGLIYYASVVLFQNVFRILLGENSQVVIVASTLVVAALFQPLRRRLQVFIDRRFYRTHYNIDRMVERFGSTLKETVEIEDHLNLLINAVTMTVQPQHVSLWVRPLTERITSDTISGT